MKLSTLRRTLLILAVICVGAIVTLLVHAGYHWIEIHTGIAHGGPDPYYNAWSGFLSDLGEVTLIGAVFAGVYGAYRKINCHDPECWRIGKHPTEGGTFMFCHHHHPDLMQYAGRKMTRDEMHQHHHEARARREGVTVEHVRSAAVDEVLTEEGRYVAPGEKGDVVTFADKGGGTKATFTTRKKPGGKR